MVFCRSESVKSLVQMTFALSEKPNQLGSKSWGSACPRIATVSWLRLETHDPACVLLLNTHLDHRSRYARVESAKLIVARLQELEEKGPPASHCRHVGTIITGDFNCWQRNNEGSPNPCFQVFEDAGFYDACSE